MALLNPFKKFAALRAHACRVGTPADMFLGRVFKGAAKHRITWSQH